MPATRHDAVVPAGDTHAFVVDLTDDATGLALDLTGAAARVIVAKGDRIAVDDTLASTGSGDGVLTVVGARTAGQLRVHLDPTTTAALGGDHELEVKVRLADGRVDQVVTGRLSFTRSLIGAGV